jgi:hypothetical protein
MPRLARGPWAGFDGTHRPGPGWVADPDHPLCPTFACLADEGAGGGLVDVVQGLAGGGSTGLTWPNGVANFTQAGVGRVDFGRRVLTRPTFTISALVSPRKQGTESGATGNGIWYQGAGGSTFGTQFGLGFLGAGQLFFRPYAGGATQLSSSGLYSLGTPVRVGVSYDRGAWQFWVGPSAKDSGGTAGSDDTAPDNQVLHLGYWFDAGDSTRYLDALVYDVQGFDGLAMNAQQWAEHAAKPYDWLTQPMSRRTVVFSAPSSAAGTDGSSLNESGSLAATLGGSDPASLGDTGNLSAALGGSDSGATADAGALSVSLSVADSAALADSGSATTLGQPAGGADGGSGAEGAVLAAAVGAAEAPALAEAGALSATLLTLDAGGLGESVRLVVAIAAADALGGGDAGAASSFSAQQVSGLDAAAFSETGVARVAGRQFPTRLYPGPARVVGVDPTQSTTIPK